MNRRMFIEKKFEEFKGKFGLKVSLCFDLPKEFAGAFGLYDVTKNILYVNIDEKISYVRLIFTFYHELRHALQYNFPEMYNSYIQMTLPYIVHFDGNCYMLKCNKWIHCSIQNQKFDFMEIYKSFPYEIDANTFAYRQAMNCLKDNDVDELDKIFKQSMPNEKLEEIDILNICEMIKDKCNN